MVPLNWYLYLSVVLFALGAIGVMVRRNVLTMLMSIELMLNAGNLAMIAFARGFASPTGHAVVMFVFAVAASEVALGLAIVLALYRIRRDVDADSITELRW
jgi:NADH-quinone oxidoreductase subunit K